MGWNNWSIFKKTLIVSVLTFFVLALLEGVLILTETIAAVYAFPFSLGYMVVLKFFGTSIINPWVFDTGEINPYLFVGLSVILATIFGLINGLIIGGILKLFDRSPSAE